MNLVASMELYAGGVGSGCHGENCGRKKSSLQEAIELATEAHKGQKDKSGFDYIEHPKRVSESLKKYGEAAMIVGALHDVVEDTHIPLSEIEKRFGSEIAEAVDAVSQRQGEKYFDYIKRAAQNPLARLVKVADIHDNMLPSRSLGRNMDSLKKRYGKALEMLQG